MCGCRLGSRRRRGRLRLRDMRPRITPIRAVPMWVRRLKHGGATTIKSRCMKPGTLKITLRRFDWHVKGGPVRRRGVRVVLVAALLLAGCTHGGGHAPRSSITDRSNDELAKFLPTLADYPWTGWNIVQRIGPPPKAQTPRQPMTVEPAGCAPPPLFRGQPDRCPNERPCNQSGPNRIRRRGFRRLLTRPAVTRSRRRHTRLGEAVRQLRREVRARRTWGSSGPGGADIDQHLARPPHRGRRCVGCTPH